MKAIIFLYKRQLKNLISIFIIPLFFSINIAVGDNINANANDFFTFVIPFSSKIDLLEDPFINKLSSEIKSQCQNLYQISSKFPAIGVNKNLDIFRRWYQYIKKQANGNTLCAAIAKQSIAYYYDDKNYGSRAKSAMNILSKYAKKNNKLAIVLLCTSPYYNLNTQDKNQCINQVANKNINWSSEELNFLLPKIFGNFSYTIDDTARLCLDLVSNNFKFYKIKYSLYENKSIYQITCDSDLHFVGNKYYDGSYGEKQDYTEAFQYLIHSDPSSDSTGISQFDLGYMYQFGLGTAENAKKALNWYLQSLQTYKNSKEIPSELWNNIGVLFQTQGDYKSAFNSLQKAARKGNALAQWGLSEMYTNGEGTLQNFSIAYAWASAAAAIGVSKNTNTNYQIIQQQIEQLRDALAVALAAEDKTGVKLEQARSLAEKYFKLYSSS